MKVTIKPGEITVEAEHARDAVEVLNSLAARVLDIYATKPEALAERVAEKREKVTKMHLRSVTAPEADRPAVSVAVPVAATPVRRTTARCHREHRSAYCAQACARCGQSVAVSTARSSRCAGYFGDSCRRVGYSDFRADARSRADSACGNSACSRAECV